MSTHKYIDRICVIITICALILTAVFMNGKTIGMQAIVDEDAESYEGTEYFTANDMNGSWDTDGATVISLTGDGAVIRGEGVYSYDGDVYISAAGRYVLSGSLDDGSVVVDAYDSSKVYLLFDGVDITCADDAGLKVEQADKVFVTLAEGSENSIKSGAEYSDEALKDEVTGAVFAHDDLTINGSGSLEVSAGYKHGIVGKDDVIITGGNITVSAPADGIRANDSLRIREVEIAVDAGDDGVVINHENGYFYMESGSLDITGGGDGFHSAGDVTVAGGNITIKAADDGIHSDTAFSITGGTLTISGCYEGIEAVTIDIAGGDTFVNCEDDGLNANGGSGDMFGMGGGMGGPGGFGGMRDGSVSGNFGPGNFDPGMMSESMPGGNMAAGNTASGNMTGRNTASGNMQDTDTASGNRLHEITAGGNMPEESSVSDNSGEEEETYIHISGGTLTVINAAGQDADGIDSNGDLVISGGTVRVSLVNNGNNNAIDYASESGGTAVITGGTVIACGSSGMAEKFDSTSSQASILYTCSEGAEAGTTVALEDTDGNVIMSYEAPQSFSSVNISCPELQTGGTYRIVIGDKVEEITLEEISASYGDAAGGGFGGMGGRGGRRGSVSSNGSDEGFMMPPGMDVSGNGGMQMPPGMDVSGNGGMQMPPGMDVSGNGGMPGGGPMDESDMQDDNADTEETSAVTGTLITDFGSDTWASLAGSVIAIILGIGVALVFKRRR